LNFQESAPPPQLTLFLPLFSFPSSGFGLFDDDDKSLDNGFGLLDDDEKSADNGETETLDRAAPTPPFPSLRVMVSKGTPKIWVYQCRIPRGLVWRGGVFHGWHFLSGELNLIQYGDVLYGGQTRGWASHLPCLPCGCFPCLGLPHQASGLRTMTRRALATVRLLLACEYLAEGLSLRVWSALKAVLGGGREDFTLPLGRPSEMSQRLTAANVFVVLLFIGSGPDRCAVRLGQHVGSYIARWPYPRNL